VAVLKRSSDNRVILPDGPNGEALALAADLWSAQTRIETLIEALTGVHRLWREDHDVLEAEVERLRGAIRDALHWHVYSVSMPDEDGNAIRIEKVDQILREALDG